MVHYFVDLGGGLNWGWGGRWIVRIMSVDEVTGYYLFVIYTVLSDTDIDIVKGNNMVHYFVDFVIFGKRYM